jgi:hypothetical protein
MTSARWNPASRSSFAMYSAPCGYPRFSAAIDGNAIQSWSIFTVWSCWPAIFAITSSFGDAAKAGSFWPIVSAAAVATVPWRKSRRLMLAVSDGGVFSSFESMRAPALGIGGGDAKFSVSMSRSLAARQVAPPAW